MLRKGHTEEQIIAALRQYETGDNAGTFAGSSASAK
jgi:hypothetical protein